MTRRRFFLSPLLLLVALLTGVGLNLSSTSASARPETRVRVSDQLPTISVGTQPSESPASVGRLRRETAVFVSATGVATNTAPSEIRLSQATVNGPRASALADDMAARGWQGDPVDVVRMPDGRLTTFDNKRVVAANDAGIDVSARVHDFDSPFPADRLGPKSPGTWGEAITQRIGDQKAGWRNQYPMGGPFTCRMGC